MADTSQINRQMGIGKDKQRGGIKPPPIRSEVAPAPLPATDIKPAAIMGDGEKINLNAAPKNRFVVYLSLAGLVLVGYYIIKKNK